MNKVKEILLSTNFVTSVFVLIGLRITVMGASIGDALAIIGVCGLIGFKQWLDAQVKDDVNAELKKEITDIKSHMSALLIKASVRPPVQPSAEPNQPKRFF